MWADISHSWGPSWPYESAIGSWEKLELSSFRSVITFADGLGDINVDRLLLNAALATRQYVQTGDGWETTYVYRNLQVVIFSHQYSLQVNYLSNALLSILLLPNLIKASTPEVPSRLVIVSSDAHFQLSSLEPFRNAPNILETLNDKEYCDTRQVLNKICLALSNCVVVIWSNDTSFPNVRDFPSAFRSQLRQVCSACSGLLPRTSQSIAISHTCRRILRQSWPLSFPIDAWKRVTIPY